MKLPMDRILARFTDYLKSKDLRLTNQRREILEHVFATDDHFTAEDCYDGLRAKTSGISKATVYRTLTLLMECHMLERLDFGTGSAYYEHVFGHEHHDHLFCMSCRAIVEFTCEAIEQYQIDVAQRHDFDLLDHSLRIFGLCAKCRASPAGKKPRSAR